MVPEAPLQDDEGGKVPAGEGWFVLNAREAKWLDGHFGAYTRFEGEERHLNAWDFVHCPPWTEHVLVGAGDAPCTIVAVGTRLTREVIYPESELAQRHGAGVKRETREPREAYAEMPAKDVPVGYKDGWLPG